MYVQNGMDQIESNDFTQSGANLVGAPILYQFASHGLKNQFGANWHQFGAKLIISNWPCSCSSVGGLSPLRGLPDLDFNHTLPLVYHFHQIEMGFPIPFWLSVDFPVLFQNGIPNPIPEWDWMGLEWVSQPHLHVRGLTDLTQMNKVWPTLCIFGF